MKRLLLLLCALVSLSTFAAPKSDLWPYWKQSNQANQSQISHQDWQQLLDAYLVEQGENTLFRYSQVSSADKTKQGILALFN